MSSLADQIDFPMEPSERVCWLPDGAGVGEVRVQGLQSVGDWLLVLYLRGNGAFLETLPWAGKPRLTLALPRPDPTSLCPWGGAHPRCRVSFSGLNGSGEVIGCTIRSASSEICSSQTDIFGQTLKRIACTPSKGELVLLTDRDSPLFVSPDRNPSVSCLSGDIMNGDLLLVPSPQTIIVGNTRSGKLQLYTRDNKDYCTPGWTYPPEPGDYFSLACACEGGGWLFAVERNKNEVHQIAMETGLLKATRTLYGFHPQHVTFHDNLLFFIDDENLLLCRDV